MRLELITSHVCLNTTTLYSDYGYNCHPSLPFLRVLWSLHTCFMASTTRRWWRTAPSHTASLWPTFSPSLSTLSFVSSASWCSQYLIFTVYLCFQCIWLKWQVRARLLFLHLSQTAWVPQLGWLWRPEAALWVATAWQCSLAGITAAWIRLRPYWSRKTSTISYRSEGSRASQHDASQFGDSQTAHRLSLWQVELEEQRLKEKAAALTLLQKVVLYSLRIFMFLLSLTLIGLALTCIYFASRFSQVSVAKVVQQCVPWI